MPVPPVIVVSMLPFAKPQVGSIVSNSISMASVPSKVIHSETAQSLSSVTVIQYVPFVKSVGFNTSGALSQSIS